ncbi:hypothetical protein HJFPF1_11860 [Paramyrothecium foliicola]|nr:hypothetical protein HJFPF1_11860 [Paramyrothecium foliicola]
MPDPGALRRRRKTSRARTGVACDYPDAQVGHKTVRHIYPSGAVEGTLALLPQPSYCKLAVTQAQYYDYFQTVLVQDFAAQPYGVSEFWHRTVLRDALQDSFVLDAVIAISALSQAIRSSGSNHASDALSLFRGDVSQRHRSQALKHYVRALANYRHLLATEFTGSATQRNILISTLLFTVFENMQGNRLAVDALRAKALLLLKDTATHVNNSNANRQVVRPLDDQGVQDATLYLTRQGVITSLLAPLYPQSKQSLTHLRQFYAEIPKPPDGCQDMRDFESSYLRFLTPLMLWLNRITDLIASGYPVETDPLLRSQQTVMISHVTSWLNAIRERLHASKFLGKHRQHSLKDSITIQLLDVGVKVCYVSAIAILDLSRVSFAEHKYTRELIGQIKQLKSLELPSPEFQKNLYERLCFAAVNLARECRDMELRSEILDLAMSLANPTTSSDLKAAVLGYTALATVENGYRDSSGVLPQGMHHDWTSASWDDSEKVLHVTISARLPSENVEAHKKLALRLKDHGLG